MTWEQFSPGVFNDSEFIPLTLNRRICKLWASKENKVYPEGLPLLLVDAEGLEQQFALGLLVKGQRSMLPTSRGVTRSLPVR